MKQIFIILLLIVQLNLESQCVANFTTSLQPNGTITLSNTSVYTGTSTPFYLWNLGNGSTFTSTSLSQTVGTTYTANGTYSISLSMSDFATPPCSSSITNTLQIMLPGCALSASATAVNSATGNATVSFINLSTGTVSGATFAWNFGDGTATNVPNPPPHVYGKNGVYGYSLTVSNNSTCNALYQETIMQNIGNLTGTAVEEYTTSVTFTVGAGGLTHFTIHKHVFNAGFSDIHFGDGVWNGGVGVDTTFSHIFYNGVHTPTVAIYGYVNGPRMHAVGPITITNNPCYINSAFNYTTLPGGVVQFSPPMQAIANVRYFWDFGVGAPYYYGSLLPNPTYTYSSAGSFSVQLVSVDTTYFSSYAAEGCGVMLPYQSPCQDIDTVNINITNIPCMSSSGFTYYPSGIPHEYYLSPYFPYNVTMANWNWGDGTSYTGPSIYTSHTYSASGFYNICLTVTTSCGTSTMTCINDYFAKGVEGD
ncbi:MAG: hypothetical protein JNL60_08180, partial [Bacteroidia bacterium]|nr:hypothetical protein [Bacteroidia bacterium]